MASEERQDPQQRLGLFKRGMKGFYILLALVLVGVLLYFAPRLRGITVAEILAYTPANLPLAALLIWGLYLIKSLTVFFPLMVLYVAVGTLFPPLWAVLVNLVGLAACCTLPYLMGKRLGKDVVLHLVERYEKARQLSAFGNRNSLLLSFLLRVINLLPGDLVSLLLGADSLSYPSYLLGSLLGLLPVMLPATLLGVGLASPTQMGFLLPCILLSLGLLGITLLLAKRFDRGKE